MSVIAEGILPLNFEPEIGDFYKTARSGVLGWVVEKVPNKTGSIRLRLLTAELTTRWTTWVPDPACAYCEAGIAETHTHEQDEVHNG